MTALVLNGETMQLLSCLHRGGSYSYWWTNPGKESIWWPVDNPAPIPNGGTNVYFGVHPSRVRKTSEERAKLLDIAAINCLFADFDAKDFNNDIFNALTHIVGLDPQPSVLISSGGGYQAYWLLETTFMLDTHDDRNRAKQIQRDWVVFVGGDEKAKDLSRILRVPGTQNYKYAEQPAVTLMRADFDRLYNLSALETIARMAQPAVATQPVKPDAFDHAMHATHSNGSGLSRDQAYAQKALQNELSTLAQTQAGGRNEQLNRSAFNLGQLVAAGLLTQIEVEQALEYACRTNGLAHDDGSEQCQATIQSGLSAGKATPRKSNPSAIPTASNGNGNHGNGSGGNNGNNGNAPPPIQSPGSGSPGSQQPSAGKPGSVKRHTAQTAHVVSELNKRGYTFRLNLCTDTVEVNGETITDVVAAELRVMSREAELKPLVAVEDAYIFDASLNAYHPIREYLTGLEWDGKQHIARLAAYYTSPDPPIVYPDGTQIPLLNVYLYRWLIGAVAKVMVRGQNAMLVLVGPQDIGKSQWARWLCSGIPRYADYFIEAPIEPKERDNDLRLISRFIWEIAELDATTRKADVSALKAFITKHLVTTRKQYGRHDITKPAMTSMIGTVNDSTGFLTDETGNRRFMAVRVDTLDFKYTGIDVNQVWAEAFARFEAGEPWRLTEPERIIQAQMNKQHEAETPLDDWIRMHFDISASALQSKLNAAEIIDHLKLRDVKLNGNEYAQNMQISKTMARLGIERSRAGYWRGYKGIARK